jgi:hypothetical protein
MRAVALLLSIVLTSRALVAQGTGVVAGAIRDEVGRPVGEALVVIDPDSLSLRTRTGADGRYRIAVPPGRFEVRIVRIGFRPHSQTIVVTETPVELNIVLQSVAIPLDTVAVRVTRPGLYGLVVTRGINILPHEPRPLPGALIEVINEPHQARTGADGRFSIPQLGIGSHAILVTLDRYATRMVPVTVPPEGGVDITFTLDSIFAEYQLRDADRMRDLNRRVRRATSPFAFVPGHEIDSDAKDLKESLRFAASILSRGVILQNMPVCIFIDGVDRPDLKLEDIAPVDIEGIEVYPLNSLGVDYGVNRQRPLTPCGGTEGNLFSGGDRGPGSFSRRTTVRSRGNNTVLIMIWTTKRR